MVGSLLQLFPCLLTVAQSVDELLIWILVTSACDKAVNLWALAPSSSFLFVVALTVDVYLKSSRHVSEEASGRIPTADIRSGSRFAPKLRSSRPHT